MIGWFQNCPVAQTRTLVDQVRTYGRCTYQCCVLEQHAYILFKYLKYGMNASFVNTLVPYFVAYLISFYKIHLLLIVNLISVIIDYKLALFYSKFNKILFFKYVIL